MINVAVPGVSGRMGSEIAEQVLQAADLQLAVATVRANNPLAGKNFSASDVIVSTSLDGKVFDVLIDFTLPEGVIAHLDYCVRHKVPTVIGTTNLNEMQQQLLEQAAQTIPILYSANMSLGVNKCYKLLALAAEMFDYNWDISIVDEHHKNKRDQPSGTAKKMAEIIADTSGRCLEEINIYSERQGDTVGTHTVTFSNPDELVMISHVAESREIFAHGALAAARWVLGKAPGLYSMQDVIA